MAMLSEIFQKPKPILGRIQLLALPGSPNWEGEWETLTSRAEQEATALATGGVDGLILENFHDTPYTRGRMDVAGAVAMAMLARKLKQFTNLPIGISVLRNDPETALAIALNTNADFIRLPLLSGALITESGVINSRMNELLHYKNQLKAELPPLLVDVSLQHLAPAAKLATLDHAQTLTHLIQIANDIPEACQPAGLIVSDQVMKPEWIQAFKTQTSWPVLIENQSKGLEPDLHFEQADGIILEADIRKASALQPGLPPTIDMTRVEEIVNRLRGVKSVSEMDPDIFLKR